MASILNIGPIIEGERHHKGHEQGRGWGSGGGIGDLTVYRKRGLESIHYIDIRKGDGIGYGNGYGSGTGWGNARIKSWG